MSSASVLNLEARLGAEPDVKRQPLKTILHVDDDDDIRVIVRMALETIGSFEVHQFATSQEAVDAAENVNPQLLLLDVMMPDMSGREVARLLKSKQSLSDLPVIFLTAKAEGSFSQELIENGALAVITKPIDPMFLAKQIEEIWSQSVLA